MAKKRNWQPREMLMVSEYLVKYYAKWPYKMRVRLGSIPQELVREGMSWPELRAAGVWRRYADAVVIKPKQLIIIEAAIKPNAGDISQLQLYKELLPHTPELEPYGNRPIALELVYAMEDPIVLKMARKAKIRVVLYRPDWLDEYLAILHPTERRGTLGNIQDLSGES